MQTVKAKPSHPTQHTKLQYGAGGEELKKKKIISGVPSEIISDFKLFISVSVRFQICEGRHINHI